MVVAWLALASAQTPLPDALAATEKAWNQAWEAHDSARLLELISPELKTVRTDARKLAEAIEKPGDDAAWKKLARQHTTAECTLAATVERDPRHAVGVLACPTGWARASYERPDLDSPWRRAQTNDFAAKPTALDGFLSGPTRYAWHKLETDELGWTHYRSSAAAATRLSVRRSEGACPQEVAMAAGTARPGYDGLVVSLTEDVGVRSTADACTVYSRAPEPPGLPCDECRVEEGLRLLQLADRLRYVEPGVSGELARGVLRRAPKSAESIYQIAALGQRAEDARIPHNSEGVERQGRIAFVDVGAVTLLGFEGLTAEGLVRGAQSAPIVWGSEDLGSNQYRLSLPVDVAASATETWVTELGLTEMAAVPLDDGGIAFGPKRAPIAEVRPFGDGSIIRFAPFGPLPVPKRTEVFRAILDEQPDMRPTFELPAGARDIEPLWACPRSNGCATGATIVMKGRKVPVPDEWLASLETCWKDARGVNQPLSPETTLKVKSVLGARVIDFASDRARREGRVYAASCLYDEGRRLATLLALHDAWAAARAGKPLNDPLDGWGMPIRVEGSGDEAVYVSYGADGSPGGEGLDADVRYAP
ncbi:MAG: hypothetical protein H6737_02910 [Alphaproteobacteria bacterium]|nr:hypothetical protein [Alphaproteobacteria bacterium]